MAKVTNIRADHTLPSLRGRMVFQTWRGKLHVQAWPKKRAKKLPDHTSRQVQLFKNYNRMTKFIDPEQLKRAMVLAEQGPLYQRDYLLAAMAGNLYRFGRADGTVIYPMSQLIEVSADLDILAQTPGSILVRGPTIWVPIVAGLSGEPLLGQGTETPPAFGPVPKDWETQSITNITRTAQSTSAFATKGWIGTLERDTFFHQVIPWFNGINTKTYKGTLAVIVGSTIDSILSYTNIFTVTLTGVIRAFMPLITPQVVAAGTKIGMFWTRTSDSTTSHPGIHRSGVNVQIQLPINEDLAWARLASINPVATQVLNTASTIDLFSVDTIYHLPKN